MNLPTQIQEKLGQRQTQAIIVGVLILAVIAVLQVVHVNKSKPLVALLESQQLGEGDLERMAFAIGKSGITGCKIDNGILMVPEHRKEECLNAIADNDALPQFLRNETETAPTVNPFLSRSQQKRVEESQKKRLIREMVVRLPFVKNAWFEMDVASGGSVFKPAQQTAVVSVEPPTNVVLDSDQVSTLREMIAGAVAGLPAENIRVIDITSGYAHRSGGAGQKVVAIDQRPPFEQETFYRKRIQQALQSYGEIDVQVRVDMVENPVVAKPVSYNKPVEVAPSQPFVAVIGTNGSASIHDIQPERSTPAPVIATPVAVAPTYTSRVDVMLQVPESVASQMSIGKAAFPADKPNIKQQATNQLGRSIVEAVKPVLPKSSFAQGTPFPISVQFVPPPVAAPVAVPTWQVRLKEIAIKHWPSAAVLLIGLVLLTIMTRHNQYDESDADELMNEDIISINATAEAASETPAQPLPEIALAQPEDYARRAAEEKLGSLVEKDPDSAARVIESWIRNAG
jgi:flagellar biosynthesis/type III secretory pathway M-ring protein FliF/YscJ